MGLMRQNQNIDVKLIVYNSHAVEPLGQEYYSSSTNSKVAESNFSAPRKLGTNLYVTCLEAKTASSNVLQQGVTYFYDIEFKDTNNNITRLQETAGGEYLKGDIKSILYQTYPNDIDIYNLSSFVLPNSNLDHLKILHGSCRKPHGFSEDALLFLISEIKNSKTSFCLTYHSLSMDNG
jgi:hypothetical protein